MKADIREAVLACMTQRTRLRDVPRGFRLSFPLSADGEHLIELNFYEANYTDAVVVSDAGAFYAALEDGNVNPETEGVQESLERLRSLGFVPAPAEEPIEIAGPVKLADIGCASLRFATELHLGISNLSRVVGDRPKDFAAKVVRDLAPVEKHVKLDYPVHGIEVPIYAPATKIAAAPVGSFGGTVKPRKVAERQVVPLLHLGFKHPNAGYNFVTIVKDEYLRDASVRKLLADVGEAVPASQMDRFYEMVKPGAYFRT